MRPDMLTRTLTACINVKRNVHIEGAPGLGKTQLTQQTVKDMGLGFIQKHVPTLQPEDLALPSKSNDNRLAFLVADWLPLVGDAGPDEGVILLDELPQGDNSVQKGIANLVQERECHGRQIKPGWSFVSTGNRQADRAGANRILSHLRARMTTLEFEPNLDDWCNWALTAGVATEVIACMRFRPDLLADIDPNREINPNPRAWVEGVSNVMGQVPSDAEFECFKGAVGEGAAAEFVAFLKMFRQLPNIDALLLAPDQADVPSEPSILFAIATAIGARANPSNFDRVMAYARRLPPEFTVLVVRDSARHDKSIVITRAFINWAAKDGADVLV